REIEIVRSVVAGYSNREIAARSSITENTVKSHLTHIFNKLGASNRVELALFAAHHRLTDGVRAGRLVRTSRSAFEVVFSSVTAITTTANRCVSNSFAS